MTIIVGVAVLAVVVALIVWVDTRTLLNGNKRQPRQSVISTTTLDDYRPIGTE